MMPKGCRDLMLEIVARPGVADAPFGKPLEPALAEVAGVAVEVLGAHRPHDDLDDQPRAGRLYG